MIAERVRAPAAQPAGGTRRPPADRGRGSWCRGAGPPSRPSVARLGLLGQSVGQRVGQQRDQRLELDVGRGRTPRPRRPAPWRPARPCCRSARRSCVSMVCAAMIRQAVTGSVWPMRWLRSIAWVCSASVQDSSASTMLEATCRLMPTPAAVSEQTAIATSGSLTNASICFCRADVVWSPRIEE